MATEIASLYARVGADISEFQRGMGQAKGEMSAFERGFGQLQRAGKAIAMGIGVASVGAIGSIVAIGTNFNSLKEQAEIAFTTMLGSGEQARAFLDELERFAAKTPFEFPDLLEAGQRLLAMGFASEDIMPMLTAVGDAVSALGGGSEKINRVTLALGQMQAKGKVSAEEMLQLTEAGIPAWDILAEKIGVDIPTAMKMATDGAIPAELAIGALVDGMNDRFGGLMEKQSTTVNGLISTLKDMARQTAGQIMEPAFETMRGGLSSLVAFTERPEFTAGVLALANVVAAMSGHISDFLVNVLPRMLTDFGEWWQSTEDMRILIGDLLIAIGSAMQPLIDIADEFVTWKDVVVALGLVIGALVATTLAGLITAIAPVVAVVGGLVLAVAAVRTAWETDFGGIQTKTMEAKDYLVSRFGELGSAVQKFGGDALHEIGLWLNGQETDFAAAKEIWGTARDAFGQVWEDVKGVLSAWGDKITEWAGVAWSAFSEKFPNAAATLQGAWDRTKETVQRFWDVVKPLLDKAIEWIQKTADEWRTGSENMSGVMETAKIAIDAVLSIIFTALETFINNAIDTITLLIQFFSGDFEGAWETAKGIVERTLNAWKTIAETALNALLDVFGLNLDDLKEIVGQYFEQGKKIVSNLWDGMKSVWNSLEDWFGRAFDALPEPVQDLLRSVYNWGRDIVQGIWNGVRDRWNEFTNWFRSAWENIKGSFTSFFRIGSPSKLFAEYGGNIAEGLAIGMKNAMPQVDAAVMGMAGTVDGTGSMMGPGPMDNGDSDLAAAIRALIAVLQQQRGGNQISVTMPQASGNSRSDLAATVQYLQALYA